MEKLNFTRYIVRVCFFKETRQYKIIDVTAPGGKKLKKDTNYMMQLLGTKSRYDIYNSNEFISLMRDKFKISDDSKIFIKFVPEKPKAKVKKLDSNTTITVKPIKGSRDFQLLEASLYDAENDDHVNLNVGKNKIFSKPDNDTQGFPVELFEYISELANRNISQLRILYNYEPGYRDPSSKEQIPLLTTAARPC